LLVRPTQILSNNKLPPPPKQPSANLSRPSPRPGQHGNHPLRTADIQRRPKIPPVRTDNGDIIPRPPHQRGNPLHTGNGRHNNKRYPSRPQSTNNPKKPRITRRKHNGVFGSLIPRISRQQPNSFIQRPKLNSLSGAGCMPSKMPPPTRNHTGTRHQLSPTRRQNTPIHPNNRHRHQPPPQSTIKHPNPNHTTDRNKQ
jgi:hypothetical protein